MSADDPKIPPISASNAPIKLDAQDNVTQKDARFAIQTSIQSNTDNAEISELGKKLAILESAFAKKKIDRDTFLEAFEKLSLLHPDKNITLKIDESGIAGEVKNRGISQLVTEKLLKYLSIFGKD